MLTAEYPPTVKRASKLSEAAKLAAAEKRAAANAAKTAEAAAKKAAALAKTTAAEAEREAGKLAKEHVKASRAQDEARKAKAAARALAEEVRAYPSPPKKPTSPFGQFLREYFATHRDTFPRNEKGHISLPDVSRSASAAWQKMSLLETDPYHEKARQETAAYKPAYRQWYEGLTPEQRENIRKHTGKKVVPPGGKLHAKKELASRPGNPGKPQTPFFKFIEGIRPELVRQVDAEKKDLPVTERNVVVAQLAAQRWAGVSQAEKDVSETRRGGQPGG